ncbi:MAG: chloramphenicol acetyltransferase [Candidatus Izemoplasmatales bacterium]|jgi:chloramphenicol O-acetyltransferase|nr:chloramphenicol acetyltransferase [Candidatus Izemoplasmatales bacterium]
MKKINIETWHRKSHFNYYKDFDMPHFSITANVDITKLYNFVKNSEKSFFATFLYYVMKTVNAIPELRYRIRNGEVYLHDVVHPSYTVLAGEDLFRFVNSKFDEDFAMFIKNVDEDIDQAKIGSGLSDEPNTDNLVYVSAIPWVTFTNLSHPFDTKHPDSFPRISWGKFFKEDEKVFIPVSLSAHHALCDGIHVGKFYQLLSNTIESIE